MHIIRRRNYPKGQGLVELLIAIAVIMTSTIASLGLVIATRTVSGVSKAQILASNLAREGVEVVRGIRDDNWLAIDSGWRDRDEWNAGLFFSLDPNAFDYSAIPMFAPANNLWQLTFGPNDIDDSRTIIYINPSNGRFLQVDNPANLPAGYVATSYRRLLSIYPVCWDTVAHPDDPWNYEERVTSNDADCEDINPNSEQVGVEVHSRVRWIEHGRPHNIEVTDKLFNWKT